MRLHFYLLLVALFWSTSCDVLKKEISLLRQIEQKNSQEGVHLNVVQMHLNTLKNILPIQLRRFKSLSLFEEGTFKSFGTQVDPKWLNTRIQNYRDQLISIHEKNNILKNMIINLSEETYSDPNAVLSRILLWTELQLLSQSYFVLLHQTMPYALVLAQDQFEEESDLRQFYVELILEAESSISVLNKDKTFVENELKALQNNFNKEERLFYQNLYHEIFIRSNLQNAQKINHLNSKMKEFPELKKWVEPFQKHFNQVSFLYNPEKNREFILNAGSVLLNLSWGLINTLAGVGYFSVHSFAAPFYILAGSKDISFVSFSLSKNQHQITVRCMNPLNRGYNVSLGIFVIDASKNYRAELLAPHEGGHAYQSALLGPFYLPLIAIAYSLYGESDNFMEHWADKWAF